MAARKNQNSSLVYSTAQGRMCPDCGKPVSTCTCRKGKASQKNNRIVQNRASSKTTGSSGSVEKQRDARAKA